jgi:L-lactate dehydrogenase complex protein LldG
MAEPAAKSPEVAAFLAKVRAPRAVGGDAPPLPAPLGADQMRELRTDDPQLATRFAAAAAAAGCKVVRTRAQELGAALLTILDELEADGALIEPQEGTAFDAARAAAVEAQLTQANRMVTRQRDDDVLFGVAASITGVCYAIAETGTLVCCATPEAARGSTLIPPVHIAIVGSDQIKADLFDAFAAFDPLQLPSNVNFITGPSKTADIESILVTGVHGPGDVYVVVVD